MFRTGLNKIRYCYRVQLIREPLLAGYLAMKFVIAVDGSVSRADIAASTMNDPQVESCMVKVFQQLQFPQPANDGVVIVTYPFIFAPG